jgi:hypothetical protein
MVSIRQSAKNYVEKKTKNIADLNEVSVELDLREEKFTDKDDKEFTIQVTTIDGEDYRVPDSVLSQLKVILDIKPNMTKFKVKKTGEGMGTKYQVVSLD